MLSDYDRIEQAIRYLQDHFTEQPTLEEAARQVHLSPFHFQRMFTEWAGVSPKKFLQFLSAEYAKGLLGKKLSMSDVSFETGFSSVSRLHDLFISVEGMSPGTYKNGGEGLFINYSYADTLFGTVLIASTPLGICHLAFVQEKSEAMEELRRQFPRAIFSHQSDVHQQNALRFFSADWNDLPRIKLHLKGTPFQLKVWQSLLKIPFGQVSTYASIAQNIQHPKAARAVGSAIGSNPVAFLIPCHRVIRSDGLLGGYHWGLPRKQAIFGWEASQEIRETD